MSPWNLSWCHIGLGTGRASRQRYFFSDKHVLVISHKILYRLYCNVIFMMDGCTLGKARDISFFISMRKWDFNGVTLHAITSKNQISISGVLSDSPLDSFVNWDCWEKAWVRVTCISLGWGSRSRIYGYCLLKFVFILLFDFLFGMYYEFQIISSPINGVRIFLVYLNTVCNFNFKTI